MRTHACCISAFVTNAYSSPDPNHSYSSLWPIPPPPRTQLVNYIAFSAMVDPHLGAFEDMVQ
jgi:hypothetical protein